MVTGEQVPFFIAAEYYKSSTSANPSHITKVGELVDGGKLTLYLTRHSAVLIARPKEGYKMKVNDRLQYGQKNAQGELRFIVYHDKERKPYQVRISGFYNSSGGERLTENISTVSLRPPLVPLRRARLRRWRRPLASELSATRSWTTSRGSSATTFTPSKCK